MKSYQRSYIFYRSIKKGLQDCDLCCKLYYVDWRESGRRFVLSKERCMNMKKNVRNFIICAVLISALIMPLSPAAYADSDVVAITFASGDSVIGVCQRLGLDYYSCGGIIMTLNGFTDTAQLEKVAVGTTLYFPVSNEKAAELTSAFAASGTGSTVTAPTDTPTTDTSADASTGSTWRDQTYPDYWGATSAGSTASDSTVEGGVTLAKGDSVKYYIVRRTIERGETLTGIYSAMGLNYNTFSNQILKLNKLSNVNNIRAGQSLLLPVTTADSAEYTVVEHKIVSSDTVIGICSAYGLSYNSEKSMLEFMNPGINFDRIRVGSYIYLALNGKAA